MREVFCGSADCYNFAPPFVPLIRSTERLIMKLYLFNPSHDEALAAGSPYYYPTKIARQLAVEWALLPGLWAEPGDCILLPDEVTDEQLCEACGPWCEGVRLLRRHDLNARFWQEAEAVEPWGWDALVRMQLQKAGAPQQLLPSDERMDSIRELSSRWTTFRVLPEMVSRLNAKGIPAVGESRIVKTFEEADRLLHEWENVMVKSLWSCSGRGVFKVSQSWKDSERGRLNKLLREQGAVEMQPFQEGVFDFALEFSTDAEGRTAYLGPSLFRTNPLGGYSGNVITPVAQLEEHIAAQMGGTDAFEQLVETCVEVLSPVFAGQYTGPFGVDMMMVRVGEEVRIFPCVEVNVRRTMGHVALNLIKRKLKGEAIPVELRKLWYFCTNFSLK